MCGIAGLISKKTIDELFLKKFEKNCLETLINRGPDNQDIFMNKNKNIVLFHSRLSILDLSKKANLPNNFNNENLILTYNGEIYNYLDIKNDLEKEKIIFQTTSDSELLLKSIDFYGLNKTLEIIDGMFSFAILNKKENKIYLIRDKLGQKPLYYYLSKNSFIFSSDIETITKSIKNELVRSNENIKNYLSLSYFPKSETIFKNIMQLESGMIFEFDINNFNHNTHKYWSIKKLLKLNIARFKKNETKKNIDLCEKTISDSVKQTLISDVNVGLFLSSGIDSTLISLLAAQNSQNKLNAYTLSFKEKNYDESDYAKKISKTLNINHEIIDLNHKDLIDEIVNLPKIYTNPFADISQLPTYILSKHVKGKNKVILTGDGGDELFSGYNRHKFLPIINNTKIFIPSLLSNFITSYFLDFNTNKIKIFFDYIFRSKKNSNLNFHERFNKFFLAFSKNSPLESYLSTITNNANFIDNFSNDNLINIYKNIWSIDTTLQKKIIYSDLDNYLTDDILTKVDRACMYNSIENRTPFLNKDVINFAMSLNDNYKIHKGQQKWILKKILSKYLPWELIYRPKTGFGVPIGSWMRNEMKDFFSDLLNDALKYDFINKNMLQHTWDEHIKYNKNNEYKLWPLFNLVLWDRKYSNDYNKYL